MNENSRKVRYTRRVIREAYFELLKQKPIGQITIGELCETADIHRGTFYQHYHDIYDLQEKIEEELLSKFDELIMGLESGQHDMAEMTTMTIFEDKDAFRVILGKNGSTDVLLRIVDKFKKAALSKYTAMGIKEEDFDFIFSFTASGCIGMLRSWARSGYAEKPEKIIANIRCLTQYGLQGMVRSS